MNESIINQSKNQHAFSFPTNPFAGGRVSRVVDVITNSTQSIKWEDFIGTALKKLPENKQAVAKYIHYCTIETAIPMWVVRHVTSSFMIRLVDWFEAFSFPTKPFAASIALLTSSYLLNSIHKVRRFHGNRHEDTAWKSTSSSYVHTLPLRRPRRVTSSLMIRFGWLAIRRSIFIPDKAICCFNRVVDVIILTESMILKWEDFSDKLPKNKASVFATLPYVCSSWFASHSTPRLVLLVFACFSPRDNYGKKNDNDLVDSMHVQVLNTKYYYFVSLSSSSSHK